MKWTCGSLSLDLFFNRVILKELENMHLYEYGRAYGMLLKFSGKLIVKIEIIFT